MVISLVVYVWFAGYSVRRALALSTAILDAYVLMVGCESGRSLRQFAGLVRVLRITTRITNHIL
jgi:hypothetical protein